jgi:hypothetical protein
MGSGTPPWLQHAGLTMAARAWPRPSPRQLEDLRQPSASFGPWVDDSVLGLFGGLFTSCLDL